MKAVISWSGGKDSALALHRARKQGLTIAGLLTMLGPGGHSRSHHIPRAILQAQAAALGLPLTTGTAEWSTYEAEFQRLLVAARDTGTAGCVFGNIDVEDHRRWCRDISRRAGLRAVHPLWSEDQATLTREFLALGFLAVIVAVNLEHLGPEWLGRALDHRLLGELVSAGVTPCGEAGEYHTLVTGGPIFRQPVAVSPGGVLTHERHAFLELRPGARPPGNVL